MSRAALDEWLARMRNDPRDEALVAAAEAFCAILARAPVSAYREMAWCKLTDAVTLTAVATRQGEMPCPSSQ